MAKARRHVVAALGPGPARALCALPALRVQIREGARQACLEGTRTSADKEDAPQGGNPSGRRGLGGPLRCGS